jgi:hypothetical protein
MPTKIERQVQVLASRSEAGLVHCRYYPLPLTGTCGCVCENTFCVSNMPCRISEVTKKIAF